MFPKQNPLTFNNGYSYDIRFDMLIIKLYSRQVVVHS